MVTISLPPIFFQNLPAERKWPEVNQRVIYPIKEVLVRMENSLQINSADPLELFCISFITMNIVEVGLQRVQASWNSHPIDGLFYPLHPNIRTAGGRGTSLVQNVFCRLGVGL